MFTKNTKPDEGPGGRDRNGIHPTGGEVMRYYSDSELKTINWVLGAGLIVLVIILLTA